MHFDEKNVSDKKIGHHLLRGLSMVSPREADNIYSKYPLMNSRGHVHKPIQSVSQCFYNMGGGAVNITHQANP